MTPKRFWTLFLSLLTLLTVGYSIRAAFYIAPYFLQREAVIPSHLSWSVFPISHDRYVAQAHYTYFVRGKRFQRVQQLSYPSFSNPYGIEQQLDALRRDHQKVWYMESNPSYASLEKVFPYKMALSTIALWCILVYFFGLMNHFQKGSLDGGDRTTRHNDGRHVH